MRAAIRLTHVAGEVALVAGEKRVVFWDSYRYFLDALDSPRKSETDERAQPVATPARVLENRACQN